MLMDSELKSQLNRELSSLGRTWFLQKDRLTLFVNFVEHLKTTKYSLHPELMIKYNYFIYELEILYEFVQFYKTYNTEQGVNK